LNRPQRSSAGLAWVTCGACLFLYASALLLLILSRGHTRTDPFGPYVGNLIDLSTSAILPVVGAVIASHRPRNPIGWLLLIGALASSLATFGGEWAFRTLFVDPGSLPGGGFALLMTQTLWVFNLSALPLVVLLFPDGTLLSHRWRPVAALAAAPAALGFPLLIVSAWGQSTKELLREENLGVGDLIIMGVIICALVTVASSMVGLVLRYVRGDATRRRQINWLFVATAILLIDGITVALFETDALWRQVISSVAFYLIPLAMAVAILRYRLYEIDRIINRALVYGAVSLVLAGIYWVSVLVLQSVLPVAERSPLVIAASTLAMVALFRPLRTRVQSFIDRRFYRTRYDAVRTVADFGARLRQEIDLDELNADLVGVVHRTMQPATVSLWLKSSEGTE
jgi:hypothetical protein